MGVEIENTKITPITESKSRQEFIKVVFLIANFRKCVILKNCR